MADEVRQGTVEPRGPAPSITALAPNDDATLGGASVAITGSRLTGATSVMFGTVAATDFVGNSDTSITATAPPQQNAGLVDVTVATPSGTSNGLQFNYHVPPNPIVTEQAVIAAGETLSGGVNTGTGAIAAILVPADWWPIANMTFQISPDGVVYNDVFDEMGNELQIAAKPGTAIVIAATWMTAIGWVKFRSGGRDHPVAQDAQRVLTVFLK